MKIIAKSKAAPLALALAVALAPAAALAVTEGEVEEAPDVEISIKGLAASSPADYLPDDSEYVEQELYALPVWADEVEYVPTQWEDQAHKYITRPYVGPGLTPGEAVRARRLLAAYQAGEATGDGASVLDAQEDVKIGVYALDPADFDGEQVFTLLHAACLTDEEMLAIIDAYAQLGLTFEPDTLNYRNCVRGGILKCSRFPTQEEYERAERIAGLIRRGMLTREDVEDAQLRTVEMNWAYALGLDRFILTPYRRMTDEELALYEFALGVSAEEGAAIDETEARARALLGGWLGQPLSMELVQISTEAAYTPSPHEERRHVPTDNEDGPAWRQALYAEFCYSGDAESQISASVWFDRETGKMVHVDILEENAAYVLKLFEQAREPGAGTDSAFTQQHALETAKAYAEKLGYTDCLWRQMGEETWEWGSCWGLCAEIEDGMWLDVTVRCGDGQIHRVQIDAAEQLAPKGE